MLFPLEIRVELCDAVALAKVDGRISKTNENRFGIFVRREYPFAKPGLRWATDIFHPNISSPVDGGVICTRLIEEWKAERTLLSLVEGIYNLVENPNIDEPLSFDSCMEARDYIAAGGSVD